MHGNAGSCRQSNYNPTVTNSSPSPTGGVRKVTSHNHSMHKSRRTSSSGSSFMSISGTSSPPAGARFDSFERPGDYEKLLSPQPISDSVPAPHDAYSPHIEPAQRRSSFLAEGMLEEHLSCERLGLDQNGCERYVLRMIECHGFRWNRYLHRLAGSDTPRPFLAEYLDEDSDCSTTDDDDENILLETA